MEKTLKARKTYEPMSKVAAKLYFVVNDFNLINNMYQFSLDGYKHLFGKCIDSYINKGTTVVNNYFFKNVLT